MAQLKCEKLDTVNVGITIYVWWRQQDASIQVHTVLL